MENLDNIFNVRSGARKMVMDVDMPVNKAEDEKEEVPAVKKEEPEDMIVNEIQMDQ
eukprot:gene20020-21983_t